MLVEIEVNKGLYIFMGFIIMCDKSIDRGSKKLIIWLDDIKIWENIKICIKI